jgi:predicted 3-demethylubiquinone-9 3-methyltransferase (glyoxalase superfamily)
MQITPQTQHPQTQQKLSPFLWFDTQAEDAARYYTSPAPPWAASPATVKAPRSKKAPS